MNVDLHIRSTVLNCFVNKFGDCFSWTQQIFSWRSRYVAAHIFEFASAKSLNFGLIHLSHRKIVYIVGCQSLRRRQQYIARGCCGNEWHSCTFPRMLQITENSEFIVYLRFEIFSCFYYGLETPSAGGVIDYGLLSMYWFYGHHMSCFSTAYQIIPDDPFVKNDDRYYL